MRYDELFQLSTSERLRTLTFGNQVCENLLALKENCKSRGTGQPYIIKASGGRDHSPEGLQHGLTHGFVIEFVSKADRDYYVFDDPAHTAFKEYITDKVDGATVVDYENGKF